MTTDDDDTCTKKNTRYNINTDTQCRYTGTTVITNDANAAPLDKLTSLLKHTVAGSHAVTVIWVESVLVK